MTRSWGGTAETKGLFECFQCEDEVSLDELRIVDDLIGESPFLNGLTEQFDFCEGNNRKFHGNAVNCCAACYALIVEPMAFWDDVNRRLEMRNLDHVLHRVVQERHGLPSGARRKLEHLAMQLRGMERGMARMERGMARNRHVKYNVSPGRP
ncbi:MAG: hypothetical protein GYA24_09930 [Candidatus Lokiarchaeota archaeon]|nr:hypothetical protein [Candidatus Lokiarchaeota archaeon]